MKKWGVGCGVLGYHGMLESEYGNYYSIKDVEKRDQEILEIVEYILYYDIVNTKLADRLDKIKMLLTAVPKNMEITDE